jgi:isopenicillin N synthase-like dioxygenase
MSDRVLDVDLLAFERGSVPQRRAVVDGVMRSLGTGFVYTSHDISPALLDTAYGALAEFFALDPAVKARWTVPESHGQTGYTGLLVETAAVSDTPDWKEMLNWGDDLPAGHPLRARYPHRTHDQVLPSEPPGLADALRELHRTLLDLQLRFLRVIAAGVGVADSYFDDLVHDGSHLTRAIHYPPMTHAPSDAHVWADRHTDINLITALPRASERGLQLRVDDDWVDIAPPEGHAVMNSGIMLERLTNGLIPAGVHRVVANAPGDASTASGRGGDRYSVVQFCHPAPWFVLSPLPSCVDADHPLRYGAIEAGALLDRVLYEIGLIRADERDPQGERR